MAKTLDFNTLKKQYLTVTLTDEEKTKVMIIPPTKKVLNDFLSMKESLSGDIGDQAIDELYGLVAKLMSHNKVGKVITKETIESTMDVEDIIVFIRAYTEFIAEVTNSKN